MEIAKLFLDHVYKLHGMPVTIVGDRDKVLTSLFWRELFLLQGTQLAHSTAYHPQTDGQTERVNQCLENSLRCMIENCFPWCKWLSHAEWWISITATVTLRNSLWV
jgi:hypothetical protein